MGIVQGIEAGLKPEIPLYTSSFVYLLRTILLYSLQFRSILK